MDNIFATDSVSPVQVILSFSSTLLEDLEERIWMCKGQVNSVYPFLVYTKTVDSVKRAR